MTQTQTNQQSNYSNNEKEINSLEDIKYDFSTFGKDFSLFKTKNKKKHLNNMNFGFTILKKALKKSSNLWNQYS